MRNFELEIGWLKSWAVPKKSTKHFSIQSSSSPSCFESSVFVFTEYLYKCFFQFLGPSPNWKKHPCIIMEHFHFSMPPWKTKRWRFKTDQGSMRNFELKIGWLKSRAIPKTSTKHFAVQSSSSPCCFESSAFGFTEYLDNCFFQFFGPSPNWKKHPCIIPLKNQTVKFQDWSLMMKFELKNWSVEVLDRTLGPNQKLNQTFFNSKFIISKLFWIVRTNLSFNLWGVLKISNKHHEKS